MKIGELQGLLEGSKCPKPNCSFSTRWACCNFSPFRGHCCTSIGVWLNQVKGRGGKSTVATPKNASVTAKGDHVPTNSLESVRLGAACSHFAQLALPGAWAENAVTSGETSSVPTIL